MSVEPGIVDANVLLYAMDAEASQHKASRALIEGARDSSTTIYLTSQILCEFYSVVTSARQDDVQRFFRYSFFLRKRCPAYRPGEARLLTRARAKDCRFGR